MATLNHFRLTIALVRWSKEFHNFTPLTKNSLDDNTKYLWSDRTKLIVRSDLVNSIFSCRNSSVRMWMSL